MWCTPKPLQGYSETVTKPVPDKKEKDEIDKPSASTTQHDLPEDAHIQDDQVID